MGIVSNIATALSPSNIRQAFRRSPPRIGKAGPPVHMPLQPRHVHSQLVDYAARDADPHDWFNAMSQADWGDTGRMIDIFTDSRDRDSHLDGVIRKRVQSMMGRPITFSPPEGFENDREANRAARMCTRLLLSDSRGFRSGITHLMTGAAYGYAVAPLKWTTNALGWRVPNMVLDPNFPHCNRFGFHKETLQLGFYEGPFRTSSRIVPLANYKDAFVAHVPASGRSDYPWRRGPVRSCVVPSFIKRKGLAFWLRLAEKFGMPQPYAIVPEGLDDDGNNASGTTVAEVEKSLQSISTYWSMVVSGDIEIGHIPMSGNVKAEVHKQLIDWAEMTMSISVLGQNLTTKVDGGGSYAAGDVHREVAGDLHLSDSIELGETITEQMCEPAIRYNMPGAPVPVCKVSTGAMQVFTIEDVKEGLATPDEYRRTKGHPAMADGRGADYRPPVSMAVPAQIGDGKPGPKPEEPEPDPGVHETIEDEDAEPVSEAA